MSNALQEVQKTVYEGYKYVADLDLERFFNIVNHSKLIEILSRTIKDGRAVSLIHKYPPEQHHANELDKELACRGSPFIRYADDAMIFCKSKRAAERVKSSITKFIESKLFLKVNREKTLVSYIGGGKYLGYSFNTRLTYWRVADSPILSRAISNDRLCKQGYVFLSDAYL